MSHVYDVERLLNALRDYQRELSMHRQRVQDAYSSIAAGHSSLRPYYQGAAASQFHSHFETSRRSFEAYVEKTQQMEALLAAKIEELQPMIENGM